MHELLDALGQFITATWNLLLKLVGVFTPHLGFYLFLVAWVAVWLIAVDWRRLRRVLSDHGWAGVLLIAFVVILVWGAVAPPVDHEGGVHHIFGLKLSNYVGKTVFVTGLLCIMLLCGSVQLATGGKSDEDMLIANQSH